MAFATSVLALLSIYQREFSACKNSVSQSPELFVRNCGWTWKNSPIICVRWVKCCIHLCLLFVQPTAHGEIISHMAKLTDTITVPMARASILWLIGEYSDRVPKIAPDVLRKMAKNFVNEVRINHFVLPVHCCLYTSVNWILDIVAENLQNIKSISRDKKTLIRSRMHENRAD